MTHTPDPPDPPDPRRFFVPFCGPLYGQTEKDRDMKLSGFVDLIEVDVKMYIKNWSDPSKGPLRA